MKPRRRIELERIDANRWRIPKSGGMRVDGIVYSSAELIDGLLGDPCLEQVANVAHLPGIVGASLGMPDIHWGYGFPIGGVAAMDPDEGGVVSPGGVGYDINCGVRLLRTNLERADLGTHLTSLVEEMYRNIPTGVGAARKDLRLTVPELRKVLAQGAEWAVERGFGEPEDLEVLEEGGSLANARPHLVSFRALERGRAQLGTLGSGNHFGEVQVVAEIFDRKAATALGLETGQINVTLHTGSRGLGHQVCTDHLKTMVEAGRRYRIDLPDRQLCCAPIRSPEGKAYLGAMSAAANYAFANRQVMTDRVRRSFGRVLGSDCRVDVVYDVCHNIAKFEELEVRGKRRSLCVHRKGATRAYPPGHEKTPEAYRDVGQPVLIPGDMGRYSFVLVGTETAFVDTFGSTCHGAGRRWSRKKAKKEARGRDLLQEMTERGVVVRAAGMATVAEEMPEAYKDVAEVVRVVEAAGLSKIVARLEPIGVIKG
ncbi:MAG: RtcB family protein [Acidobacteriota bacterium]|nr:RtcB family protein [Acidobacteriota bacterium]